MFLLGFLEAQVLRSLTGNPPMRGQLARPGPSYVSASEALKVTLIG